MGGTSYPAVDDAWRIPDSLWQRIEPLLPQERPHPKGGRRYTPARQCMDGILRPAHGVPVEGFTTGFGRGQHCSRSFSAVAGCRGLPATVAARLVGVRPTAEGGLGVASDGRGDDQSPRGGEMEQVLTLPTVARGEQSGVCLSKAGVFPSRWLWTELIATT